jgi:hypothetical protein
MNSISFSMGITFGEALLLVLAVLVMLVTTWVISQIISRILMTILQGIVGQGLAAHQSRRWMERIEAWATPISICVAVVIVVVVSLVLYSAFLRAL